MLRPQENNPSLSEAAAHALRCMHVGRGALRGANDPDLLFPRREGGKKKPEQPQKGGNEQDDAVAVLSCQVERNGEAKAVTDVMRIASVLQGWGKSALHWD